MEQNKLLTQFEVTLHQFSLATQAKNYKMRDELNK